VIKIDLIFIDDEQYQGKVIQKSYRKKYEDEHINVHFFDESKKALQFILENENQMVLVLDLKMRDGELQGSDLLVAIREKAKKIPVIIKSGNHEVGNEEFSKLINNDVAFFVQKATHSAEEDEEKFIKNALKMLMANISVALDEYIKRDPNRETMKIVTKDGLDSTLKDLLNDVQENNENGIHFEKALYKIAINLLANEQ